MDKEQVIAELRRVGEVVGSPHITQRDFRQHSRISTTTVTYTFGSWNEAISAAGLEPTAQGPPQTQPRPDEEYLLEIIRLTKELGRTPTQQQLSAKGRFSVKPYRRRWGSLGKACEAAYAKYGFPQLEESAEHTDQPQVVSCPADPRPTPLIPQTYAPSGGQRRKKVQFGEPLDFRGLRFAPVNEQGVVYLFGMVSRELGFLIESIRTEYPDCEGKRCVDTKNGRWEHVLIEFEYTSGDFLQHGHNADDCDLVVCWIHDWEECPVEVLELRSQMKYLPNNP